MTELERQLTEQVVQLTSTVNELKQIIVKDTLNKSPHAPGGKFCARLRCQNLEIHKVFLRFCRLGGRKICSPKSPR